MLVSGACNDKGAEKCDGDGDGKGEDISKGTSADESEGEDKRVGQAEVEGERGHVMEVKEGVDGVFRNIYYLISGGHIGPGFDKLLNYLLFAVFGSF